MKPGETFGNWKIGRSIDGGNGGNSCVFEAVDSNGTHGALKLLTRFDRYERFRDEVAFQRTYSEMRGILPLIDSYLPERPSKSDRPWLVTPIANPIRESINAKSNKLEAAVRAICSIAETLSKVHELGAAHRDIKPENLFVWRDDPVLGDFGLVTYPGKNSITEVGERIGPIHFVAPELIGNEVDTVDYTSGDVYSLAKTLWVLVTGQQYPFPGTLDASELKYQLSQYVNSNNTVHLERLIERSTSVRRGVRPTAPDFANELRAWLNNDRETVGKLSIAQNTSARLRQFTDRTASYFNTRSFLESEYNKLLTWLHLEFVEIGKQIASVSRITSSSARIPDGSTNAITHFIRQQRSDFLFSGNRFFEEYYYVSHPRVTFERNFTVTGGAVLNVFHDGNAELKGGLFIGSNLRPAITLIQPEFRFKIGTAEQAAKAAELVKLLLEHVPIAMDKLADILAEEYRRLDQEENIDG